MNSVIQIGQLSHTYGRRQALVDVTLSIAAGEIFGLLGPNGSGKTTLFRILATLLDPQQGHVSILGMDLPAERAQVRSRIGVVFQSPSLDKQLTAAENLRYHGHLYGLRGSELRSRIDNLLERFGLMQRRDEYVGSLSGGLRRRVEIVKGLLTGPRILLMDEPSTGLDPGARLDMWRMLLDVRQNDGVTILVTTHLMDEADRCDRLAILERGRLMVCDTPATLKNRIGGDVITLTSHDMPALRASLRSRFSLEAEESDGSLRIELPRAHEFVPQLVESLPGLIDSVLVGKPSLEDVFRHVTGHRFKDE